MQLIFFLFEGCNFNFSRPHVKRFQEENFYFSLFCENPLKIKFIIGFGRAKSHDNKEEKNFHLEKLMKAISSKPMKKKTHNFCETARKYGELKKDALKAEIRLNIYLKYFK